MGRGGHFHLPPQRAILTILPASQCCRRGWKAVRSTQGAFPIPGMHSLMLRGLNTQAWLHTAQHPAKGKNWQLGHCSEPGPCRKGGWQGCSLAGSIPCCAGRRTAPSHHWDSLWEISSHCWWQGEEEKPLQHGAVLVTGVFPGLSCAHNQGEMRALPTAWLRDGLGFAAGSQLSDTTGKSSLQRCLLKAQRWIPAENTSSPVPIRELFLISPSSQNAQLPAALGLFNIKLQRRAGLTAAERTIAVSSLMTPINLPPI